MRLYLVVLSVPTNSHPNIDERCRMLGMPMEPTRYSFSNHGAAVMAARQLRRSGAFWNSSDDFEPDAGRVTLKMYKVTMQDLTRRKLAIKLLSQSGFAEAVDVIGYWEYTATGWTQNIVTQPPTKPRS